MRTYNRIVRLGQWRPFLFQKNIIYRKNVQFLRVTSKLSIKRIICTCLSLPMYFIFQASEAV